MIDLKELNKPTITQIDGLVEILRRNEILKKTFDLENMFDHFWGDEPKITLRQYNYILHLIYSKNYSKLKEILVQLGFKTKKYEPNKTYW